MRLSEFTLFFLILFVSAVLLIVLIKQCSVKDATIICRDFIKGLLCSLFSPSPAPEVFYPTIVGYANGRIVPQFVDESFSKVCQNFATCYCVDAKLSSDGSYVSYRFDIHRKPDSLEDDALTLLIQKQAEQTLTETMRLYNCYFPAEPLTVVGLFPHALNIVFARNEMGIKTVERLKHSLRKRKNMSTSADNSSMSETWKE